MVIVKENKIAFMWFVANEPAFLAALDGKVTKARLLAAQRLAATNMEHRAVMVRASLDGGFKTLGC